MIDTHAHLYLDEFKDDRDQVIRRSKDAGIDEIWLPGIDVSSLPLMESLYESWPDTFKLFAGLHPCDVGPDFKSQLETIFERLNNGLYTGIGEIGLDLYWDKTYYKEQVEALRMQLDKAVELGMVIIMHVRDASREVMPVIRDYYGSGLKGIFHSYAGDIAQALELTENGFFIGVNGSITFKKSDLATFINQIPLEFIVSETDSPFLCPVPNRGKRNDPTQIPVIISKIAELYGKPFEEVKQIITDNAKRLIMTLTERG